MQPLNEQQSPVTNQPPQAVAAPLAEPAIQPYQPHPVTQAFQPVVSEVAQPTLQPFQPLQLAVEPATSQEPQPNVPVNTPTVVADEADTDFTAPGVTEEQPQQPSASPDDIQWHASEYIQHEKSVMWYAILAAIAAVPAAVLVVFIHDYIFATLLVVMAIAVAVYARRPPRDIQYVINRQGIFVSGILHRFEDFKSFCVTSEEAFFSIQLTPLKRFRPPVVLYFAQEDGERIVDALGAHIPLQPVKHDLIEQFSRFVRF